MLGAGALDFFQDGSAFGLPRIGARVGVALGEMHRVLERGGRAYLNVPSPKPALFQVMTDALASHFEAEIARFADLVFSMHDADELNDLMSSAGFRDIKVRAATKRLDLPAPPAFLWQYIYSTPMADAVAQADRRKLAALEHDVCRGWAGFVANGRMRLEVGMTTASGFRAS